MSALAPWRDWYHCVVTTYGAWLRGDPRGWRSRHHREHIQGDYRRPPSSGTYVAIKAIALLMMMITVSACREDHAMHQQSNPMITVGQDYASAHRIAVASGYPIRDAAMLERVPTPTGFVVDLPEDRGLIVECTPDRHRVTFMQIVSHWSVSKSARVYQEVQRFELPPAKRIP